MTGKVVDDNPNNKSQINTVELTFSNEVIVIN